MGANCGPLFIRNSENVTVKACVQQLRTRECTDCTFFLRLPGDPIIEMSKGMRFAPLLEDLSGRGAGHRRRGLTGARGELWVVLRARCICSSQRALFSGTHRSTTVPRAVFHVVKCVSRRLHCISGRSGML